MTGVTRRRFAAGAALGAIALPVHGARAQAKPRVVVVGGGIGGVTMVRYLAMSGAAVDLTLVEPKPRYTTCVFSNLYLAGMRSFESLTYSYEALVARHSVKLVHDQATAVDPMARRVRLAGGTTLPYDRLVLSPGIAFVPGAIEGYDPVAAETIPHAWTGGPQTRLLRAQLEAMADGGLFVITVPRDPLSCPLAPYERASLAAYYFKQFKPRSKVMILDSKESFPAQDLFTDGWNRHFPGMVEWVAASAMGGVTAVDGKARSVTTGAKRIKADVLNVIPPQCAGDIGRQAGVVDVSGWCPVDPLTFESRLQPAIHVIGDAAEAGDMPKSAFAANSQAKACAFAIAAALTGRHHLASHLFDASFSFLAGDDAVSCATSFSSTHNAIKIVETISSRIDETKDERRQTVQQAHGWYDAFMRDTFG